MLSMIYLIHTAKKSVSSLTSSIFEGIGFGLDLNERELLDIIYSLMREYVFQ
jgi:hypothetical protein